MAQTSVGEGKDKHPDRTRIGDGRENAQDLRKSGVESVAPGQQAKSGKNPLPSEIATEQFTGKLHRVNKKREKLQEGACADSDFVLFVSPALQGWVRVVRRKKLGL